MTTITIDRAQIVETLFWDELTQAEQAEFDWLDTEESQHHARFSRYRGEIYCWSEWEVASDKLNALGGWDAVQHDTAFSGMLVRIIQNDPDHVQIATFAT
jgi:hypothetical protein